MWKDNPDLSSGLTEFFSGFWKNRNKKSLFGFCFIKIQTG